MKSLVRLVIILAPLAVLTGCQNPYTHSYVGAVLSGAEQYLQPHTGAAQVVPVTRGSLEVAIAEQEQRGYVVVGRADFTADAGDYDSGLQEQAAAAQADLVLTQVTPAESRSGVQRQTGIETGKDYSNMSSAAPSPSHQGSSGGFERATGYSTPSYTSYSVEQNRYQAVFLRKRVFVLGANVAPAAARPVPGAAMEVTAIIENSPAYLADIHRGDVITAVDGKTFGSIEDYTKLVNGRAGRMTEFTLERFKVPRNVLVKLNPLPAKP